MSGAVGTGTPGVPLPKQAAITSADYPAGMAGCGFLLLIVFQKKPEF